MTAELAKESGLATQSTSELNVAETTDSSNGDKPVGVVSDGC